MPRDLLSEKSDVVGALAEIGSDADIGPFYGALPNIVIDVAD